jgi:hypothetical protein
VAFGEGKQRKENNQKINMKKLCTFIGVAGVLFATNLYASFGTINLYQDTSATTGYSYGNGGEFQAVTSGLGTFQTFCIEDTEYFSPGGTYYYNINGGAVAGGVNAGNGSPIVPGYDPLSIGTAYLYSQFRAGSLYNTAAFGTTRMLNAGDLQQAIWFLEDEGGTLSVNMAGILTAGLGAGGMGDINWKKDSNGAYGVVALNLFDSNGNLAQDQLGIVPEPTTMIAGALLLLPFGASTLRILRKRQTA